ncbi:MAG TPA: Gfo/Idh/MocA family oxidoreductase, partial [Sphingobacterium sp.]|nr:Gfo/Idh/MocA family oxidoreductase [Sphingobacterium sp.]
SINVKTYTDYKAMLQDDIIDAVIIATPDHWHCLQMIDAVAAGKHVYVEKPVANSIKECEAMVAAAVRHNAIVQVGQWQRSQQHFRDAVDFVHSGKLGNIRLAKAWAYLGWKKRVPVLPDSEVPRGVDYLAWQGPAKRYPFNPNRFHYNFRWYWDYAGGLMTDWGVHLLDYALLGMKADLPKSIMVAGGKYAYPEDAGDTPDTMTAVYQFDNFNIIWEHATGINNGPYGRGHGIAFIGDNGTLVLDRGGWEVIPEKDKMEAVPPQKSQDNGLEKHMNNFVEAILKKDRNILKAPIEAGAHIATLSQMANIAYKTDKKLYWDKTKKKFTDKEANKHLMATYHNGYKIPK